jgi:diaminopimelate epimerase
VEPDLEKTAGAGDKGLSGESFEGLVFWKMSGSGNDFILVDNRSGRVRREDMPGLARRICRRRESVGADGLIFVEPSERYDFAWMFFNSDGSEAEMCGNGGRCAARFAALQGAAGESMTFETKAGPISAEVRGRVVKIRMPLPSGLSMDVDLPPEPGWKTADFINTGVPHLVVTVDDLEGHPVVEHGRRIRYHELFKPAGTNADFARVTGIQSLELRTYERGVENETLACGTGAMAAALVSAARGLVRSPVRVLTRGGEELFIHFEQEEGAFPEVWLEGNTTVVYRAALSREAL